MPAWSSYKIIDSHGHIGRFEGYDLSLQTLQEEIKKSGVQKVLVSNIDGADIPSCNNFDETKTNSETERIVKSFPRQLRGLLWARPADGKAAKLESFLKVNRDKSGKRIFVGMKFHPEFNHFPADDPRIDPYLNLCDKYKIPAVFHCGQSGSNSDPEKIYSAARRHKSVPVILYHMGFGTDHKSSIKVAASALHKNDAQLYVETSQVDPDTVIKAIRDLGPKHVLFGTDATYFGKSHYSHYKTQIEALHASLSIKDFDAVVHSNAARLFGLQEDK